MMTSLNELLERKFEQQGKQLISEIERKLSIVNYNVDSSILKQYDQVIDRDVWDKELVTGLKDILALIENKV